jgi:hypothetical protein
MPHEIIDKCCARTHVEIEHHQKINQGSGVIVIHNGNYFLVTAAHCIFGKENQYHDIIPEKIWVEVQEKYNTEFKRIIVKSIIDKNPNDDWVLLEINNPLIDCDFAIIRKGKKFISDENVHFTGYQNCNANEFRRWEGKIISKTDNEFKIKLIDGDTFQQSGEDGVEIAGGLSGSGVFLIRGKNLYLIGHLKSVITERALNNDIKCCPLINLESIFEDNYSDLGEINELEEWTQAVETKCTEEDIANWIRDDENSENLTRKSRVIYTNEERANKFIHDSILSFLDKENEIRKMRNNGKLIMQYDATSVIFETSVKDLYNRTVSNSSEAKDLLIRLENDFKNHIKDLINDKSNKITLELAKHKVTEWLMNCTFDFKE